MKQPYRIATLVIAVMLIAGGGIFLMSALRKTQPAPPVPQTPAADIHIKASEKPATPLPSSPVVGKAAAVKPQASSLTPPAADYPVEQEEKFVEEAMATLPKLIEVEVHEPGVVFFRHKPARPEDMETAMEDLAQLYRTRLKYDKPVNVVFFISGRPVKAKMF
jgi:type IV secretory pathway VirB10-like protein